MKSRGSVARSLFLTLIFFWLALFSQCTLFQGKDSFRFIFMTDIHLQPEGGAIKGFKKAIDLANELKPDFVITGGDLIMDALGQSYERADSLYNLYIEYAKLFKMDVYNCIGNHDHLGVYTSSGVDQSNPEYGKKIFMKRFGLNKTYRSFDHGRWQFILMDDVHIVPGEGYTGGVDSLQLVWLKNDLKKVGTKRPVVLALHIPLYSVRIQFVRGSLAANSSANVATNADQVWNICKDYNIKVVLQGHLHVIEEIVWKGTHFITGGAVSGAWWGGPFEGFPEGFVVVDIKGDEFDWYYKTLELKPGEEK